MKTRIITSAVVAVFLLLVMTSCRTTRTYPDQRYPDGRTYPTSRYPGHLPPGHAKKVYGHKSARVFAPGQQNKQWKRYDDRKKYKVKKYSKKKRR